MASCLFLDVAEDFCYVWKVLLDAANDLFVDVGEIVEFDPVFPDVFLESFSIKNKL